MENSGLNYQSGPNIAGGATNPTYHHYRSAGHNGAKTFLKSHIVFKLLTVKLELI